MHSRRIVRALTAVLLAAALLALVPGTAGAAPARTWRVRIVNLTGGQPFSPPVVATHDASVSVFRVGRPASFGVQQIAENGNNGPLLAALDGMPGVYESKQAGTTPLVPPGTPGGEMFPRSVTFRISSSPDAKFLSFVTMLVCTNDGFTGGSSLRLPTALGQQVRFLTAGYDAGTEINTEDFADLVPPCQSLIGVSSGEPGTGESNPALAEGGVIHHHPGIQGIADLVPEVHGWTDPVARIVITRIA